jgi:hypothetical protein
LQGFGIASGIGVQHGHLPPIDEVIGLVHFLDGKLNPLCGTFAGIVVHAGERGEMPDEDRFRRGPLRATGERQTSQEAKSTA